MRLNDIQILNRCKSQDLIHPYVHKQVGAGMVSFGLSSAGYDIRLGQNFKLFSNMRTPIIDPKKLPDGAFFDWSVVPHEAITIPPNSFALGSSYEHIKMPNDLQATCVGKSTYARCGIIVNVTPLEPGWEGQITIEISNTTTSPAKVYAMEGIMQVLFDEIEPCNTSYADREGKYQGQKGITLPKIMEE